MLEAKKNGLNRIFTRIFEKIRIYVHTASLAYGTLQTDLVKASAKVKNQPGATVHPSVALITDFDAQKNGQ